MLPYQPCFQLENLEYEIYIFSHKEFHMEPFGCLNSSYCCKQTQWEVGDHANSPWKLFSKVSVHWNLTICWVIFKKGDDIDENPSNKSPIWASQTQETSYICWRCGSTTTLNYFIIFGINSNSITRNNVDQECRRLKLKLTLGELDI